MKDLKDIQLEYHQKPLNREQLKSKPLEQLLIWFDDVEKEDISYRNAATLSTVDSNGNPQARTVLIKEIREEGLLCYTDFSSQKGQDLANNPVAHILFFWKELDRQIRIRGKASRIPQNESKQYFQSRPRGSQASAFASNQSSPTTKEQLEQGVAQAEEKESIPCPKRWGGFYVAIEEAEFWQGRPNRLHDRFKYQKDGENWKIERLAP